MRALTLIALSLATGLVLTGCAGTSSDSLATTTETSPTSSASEVPPATLAADATPKETLQFIVNASITKAMKLGFTQLGTENALRDGFDVPLTWTTVYVEGAANNKCLATLASETGFSFLDPVEACTNSQDVLISFDYLRTVLADPNIQVEHMENSYFHVTGGTEVPLAAVPNSEGLLETVVYENIDRARFTETYTYGVDAAGKKILADAIASS